VTNLRAGALAAVAESAVASPGARIAEREVKSQAANPKPQTQAANAKSANAKSANPESRRIAARNLAERRESVGPLRNG
jgi:hypothetical protein